MNGRKLKRIRNLQAFSVYFQVFDNIGQESTKNRHVNGEKGVRIRDNLSTALYQILLRFAKKNINNSEL